MNKYTYLLIVPACTLSTCHEGRERTLSSQVSDILLTMRSA